MKNYTILTPGEKIKNLRHKFDLKQEDLAGGEITRNLISIIENNKANLTEPVAKILVNNINRLCVEKNIDFKVTEEYLLEDVMAQAKKIADDYISYIDTLSIAELNSDILSEIDVFLKTYNPQEKKAILHMEIGSKFRSNNQHVTALDYFIKAYESSQDIEVTTKALTMLSSCNIYLGKYEDAINYSKILLDLNNKDHVQFITKYNLALCYKKLNKLTEALDILYSLVNNYSHILSTSSMKNISVNLLIGSCLNESKSFNKAINLYKDLLKSIPETYLKEKICILSNLADVYRDTNDCIRLEKTCSKILAEIAKDNTVLNEYESYIYLSLSKNLRFINKDIDVVISLLLKSLDNLKTNKCSLYLEDVENLIGELLSIFINNNDDKNISFLKNEMFELIEKNIFPKANLSSLKFIKYYNYKDNKEEINNMIDYLVV